MDTEKLQIHLSSRNAESKNGNKNSECKFYLQLDIPSEYQIHMGVVNASIPYSFYGVNEWNNKIKISKNSSTFTYTIPAGNYGIYDLVKTLNEILTGITATYDKITNKMTFSSSIPFIFQYIQYNAYEMIGIDLSLLNGTQLTTTSNNCINLQTTSCINIVTDFQTNSISLAQTASRNVLACVPITSAPNSYINYENPNDYRDNLFTNVMDVITIRLTDSMGRLLDFNGVHWNMTMQLDIVLFV